MASKFPAERDEKVKLRTRKGHDMTWSCDIHGEPIKFYCKDHKFSVCHPCATKDHQKPCHLRNIGDFILELGRKVDDKRLEIEETRPHFQKIDSKIQSCLTDARNHLQSVDDVANATFESKMKHVEDKKRDEISLINEEADEDIRKINENRQNRTKSCNEEAEQQQLIIKEKQAKVLLETKGIRKVVSRKIKDLKSKNEHAISTMDNIDSQFKRIKQDDKTLVNEAPQVLASLDGSLSLNGHQNVSDCLDRIKCGVQKVKFVEGEVGGEYYGRIDGYIGKWKLIKSIHIPSIVNVPEVCGLISDDEIGVRDVKKNVTYITNCRTEHTHKVIEGDPSMNINFCAPIASDVIVCGKAGRDRSSFGFKGCITLYDRQWKVIKNISIPRKKHPIVEVYVDVDRDGMILAAHYGQSNIYVINPAECKVVKTITIKGKEVKGEIQALSSGDTVVQTGDNAYTVISRSAEVKAAIHRAEWCTPECRLDKLTDTLYIKYWDVKRTIFAVDQVSCDGIIHARRILEYKKSDRSSPLYTNPCLVTPSGNLVACNGDTVCVYKQRFIL